MRRAVVVGITVLVAISALSAAASAGRLGARRVSRAKVHTTSAGVPLPTSPGFPSQVPLGTYTNGQAARAAAILAKAQHVLRVGSFRGIPGQFSSIQAAVDAAHPGDVILIAPGDYKTTSIRNPTGHPEFPAGVLIETPDLTIRGMNRNTVIVDGTKSGSACNGVVADQNYGPPYQGHPAGLNGLMVYKTDDVAIENLTSCNFLGGQAGDGESGNEVWWNGGDNSGVIGGWNYYGAYLNGTSLFYHDENSAAEYGIFSSNWDGGEWDHTYGSNMNDSGMYIGACQQQCNQVVDDAWLEYNALGYSGSNSGGSLVVENSQFDNNQDGFDTNSQNGDNPPPQIGACPDNGISPVTNTHSCWVFMDNWSHDNNNPDAPSAGSAAAGPIGTGMSVSGGRFDTVMHNLFADNGAWGDIFVPYPDNGPPCTGGDNGALGPGSCLYDEWGDALIDNTYDHNGYFGNSTNGDFAELNFTGGNPTDCYSGNTDVDGTWTSSPSGLETSAPSCTGAAGSANINTVFLDEVACDSGTAIIAGQPIPCLPGDKYPKLGTPVIHPLPPASQLPTMPDVCGGIPADPWCSGTVTKVAGCVARAVSVPLSTAVGEKVTSVAVKVAGKSVKTKAGATSVRVPLSGHHGTVRVLVSEQLKVGRHVEKVSFTRVYKRC